MKKRFLVYTTIGNELPYAKVARMMLRSLFARGSHRDEIDAAVMCDNEFYAALNVPEARHIVCPSTTTPVSSSMQKLDIFANATPEWLGQYELVVYIDADILVNMDLIPLLAAAHAKLQDGKLGVYRELDDAYYNRHYSLGSLPMTPSEVQAAKARGHDVFNAGFYVFAPSPKMQAHFQAIRELIAGYTGDFFYEQSFMNYHFLRCGDSETVVKRDNYVMFPNDRVSHRAVVHFCGAGAPGITKLQRMINYWNVHMAEQHGEYVYLH